MPYMPMRQRAMLRDAAFAAAMMLRCACCHAAFAQTAQDADATFSCFRYAAATPRLPFSLIFFATQYRYPDDIR